MSVEEWCISTRFYTCAELRKAQLFWLKQMKTSTLGFNFSVHWLNHPSESDLLVLQTAVGWNKWQKMELNFTLEHIFFTHPQQHLFILLLLRKQCREVKCNITKLKDSFYPSALGLITTFKPLSPQSLKFNWILFHFLLCWCRFSVNQVMVIVKTEAFRMKGSNKLLGLPKRFRLSFFFTFYCVTTSACRDKKLWEQKQCETT